MAGLLKAVLVLQHGRIPPTANARGAEPGDPWDELGLRVPIAPEAWPRGGRPPRRRDLVRVRRRQRPCPGREAPPMARRLARRRPARLAVLSARTPAALDPPPGPGWSRLASCAPPSLRDVCHTLPRAAPTTATGWRWSRDAGELARSSRRGAEQA